MALDPRYLGRRVLWMLVLTAGLTSLACQGADALAPLVGTWGGDGVKAVFSPQGAQLQYDCAAGSMNTPARPDAQGKFTTHGFHEAYRIGPDLADQASSRRAATYEGQVVGTVLELAVRVDGDAAVYRYRLDKNRKVKLSRCL